ncbi:Fanconi anemia core complex-associated protein 24 isoform X3 [Phyllopteryx taeniolatus]|uniref:Fanconi anemia core complex-associated protein 24 isoform X3 n=1 Tax=Phyllopteryx taeniolatus TaxID=161469 RepID=UPI002AD5206F|nr:Fanconi anemia core complex-associated protein 24 isoform X3 [Phyllopteryx taeniolatus]
MRLESSQVVRTNVRVWTLANVMESNKAILSVPAYGHVIASEKWSKSSLIQNLKGGGVTVLLESEPGVADFLLPDDSRVLYLSERDIVAGAAYKRKLVRFRKVHADGKENPLRRRSRSGPRDAPVLAAVRRVPGVGRVKAPALLERFSSIRQLCNATVAELEAAIKTLALLLPALLSVRRTLSVRSEL